MNEWIGVALMYFFVFGAVFAAATDLIRMDETPLDSYRRWKAHR